MAVNPASSARYEGKPLLRLLECYTLKVINELSPADEANLAAMVPKLEQVYKQCGSWSEIIAAVMKFPASMPTLIMEMWKRNQEIAKANNLSLSPQQFAEMFVDQNLE